MSVCKAIEIYLRLIKPSVSVVSTSDIENMITQLGYTREQVDGGISQLERNRIIKTLERVNINNREQNIYEINL